MDKLFSSLEDNRSKSVKAVLEQKKKNSVNYFYSQSPHHQVHDQCESGVGNHDRGVDLSHLEFFSNL